MLEGNSHEEKNSKALSIDVFAFMDEYAKTVELFTGCKQQFVDAGWSSDHAEEMVILFLKKTVSDQMKGLIE